MKLRHTLNVHLGSISSSKELRHRRKARTHSEEQEKRRSMGNYTPTKRCTHSMNSAPLRFTWDSLPHHEASDKGVKKQLARYLQSCPRTVGYSRHTWLSCCLRYDERLGTDTSLLTLRAHPPGTARKHEAATSFSGPQSIAFPKVSIWLLAGRLPVSIRNRYAN